MIAGDPPGHAGAFRRPRRSLREQRRDDRVAGAWYTSPSARSGTAGWHNGGNRKLFEEMARTAESADGPASDTRTGKPVAWCAMGPRSRYPALHRHARGRCSRDAIRTEDDDVWLFTCFFTRVGFRSKGADTTRSSTSRDRAGQDCTARKPSKASRWPMGAKRGSEYVGRETGVRSLRLRVHRAPDAAARGDEARAAAR